MNEFKFYVIGGQYNYVLYGGSDSLRGAKIIAGKNMEYWDNWQGWHKPHIYHAEDTEIIIDENGIEIRIPKHYADPIE